MTIKNTVISTSFLVAMGLSLPGFADSKVEIVDGDKVPVECIAQAEVDIMSAEDKAKLTVPICEEIQMNEEGAETKQ